MLMSCPYVTILKSLSDNYFIFIKTPYRQTAEAYVSAVCTLFCIHRIICIADVTVALPEVSTVILL